MDHTLQPRTIAIYCAQIGCNKSGATAARPEVHGASGTTGTQTCSACGARARYAPPGVPVQMAAAGSEVAGSCCTRIGCNRERAVRRAAAAAAGACAP